MTDDQLAATISFGVPTILGCFLWFGIRLGRTSAIKIMRSQLQTERSARIQRWTPPPTQPSGDPGTPERLLSDYEDAIYAETRHAAFAQLGNADEQHHVAVAAQLHADVRYLRGRVLAEMAAASSAVPQRTNT